MLLKETMIKFTEPPKRKEGKKVEGSPVVNQWEKEGEERETGMGWWKYTVCMHV